MRIDQVALLPTYVAAATAVLALMADLVVPGRRGAVTGVTALGMLGTIATAITVGVGLDGGRRTAFCVGPDQCSLVFDPATAIVAGVFAALALGALALSVPLLRTGEVPAGEYCFLLACSLTGAVVLGGARDLITLVVALETLTLPLYLLVGLRRGNRAGGAAAVTFFVVSVVSTAVALLGAALVFTATGGVHFADIAGAEVPPAAEPLLKVGVILLLTGLAFKVAAVPTHAWAPTTYDGAPLPVAAYLSTASKLGGVVALLLVGVSAARPVLATSGLTLAVLAVLSMTVGNLVALRQRRMVRLLAWSSVAQAGYLLAPLGALLAAGGRTGPAVELLVAATIAYAFFYVVLEFSAFGAIVGVRGAGDGGEVADYRGLARRSPWLTAVLVISLTGLAGLPPGLAGLFAKVAVVRSLLGGDAVWLAIVVALNAVVGLAYYVRAAATLFAPAPDGLSPEPRQRVSWPVATAVAVAAVVAVLVGLAPELVMRAAGTFS
ncbi:proton-conducting transporter membrane subunit [Dactylosporangium sp. AC04546]|uniref:NADH-quinone oxidoreductase subunit N n=1 Tax=Dactylosporangium sp. AC04546 TaxID=2862460 RepID=UPI001EE0323B|nr:proton-conducting transporter membrane subunit [Dactylosporangium sp. AC04546]WVK83233.1 proton-conducting transporter membrane subunit [Dactylosporangium sp. AC04546]